MGLSGKSRICRSGKKKEGFTKMIGWCFKMKESFGEPGGLFFLIVRTKNSEIESYPCVALESAGLVQRWQLGYQY